MGNARSQGRFRGFRYWHEVLLAMLLAGLLLVAWRVDPGFLSFDSQAELSTHVWELALLTLPMTLIIITAGIDLSVGSTMALCAVILGLSYRGGITPWIGAVFALSVGATAGAVNGAFVAWVRVHPLIVTLATMAAYRGIAVGISLAEPVSNFPEDFAVIGRGYVAGVPVPGLIFAVAAIVAAVALARTRFGRYMYAIGHSEAAARYAGVNVDRIKLWLYALSGAVAGLAAVMFVARRNTAKADIARGMELEVITAVVLGGTSIFGGRGRIIGTLLGVLLIHEVQEFVSWHWEKDELRWLIVGLLLIGMVLLNNVVSRRRAE